ncbi:MAG: GNAT family N-acetyltransferase [Candidatus Aureabacteria bacterium]|nr:GNAT family N-acetyltransferase [Candidatus Auribacterota bacterium]
MLTVRKVEKKDEKEVQELIESIMHNEFMNDAKHYTYADLESITSYYSGEKDYFYVAEIDGKIIGTGAVKQDDNETALLRRVFVHPYYRNKGYGLVLIETAIDFCKKHGYKNLVFRGTSRMERALNVCKKKGFQEKERLDLGDMSIYIYNLALQ